MKKELVIVFAAAAALVGCQKNQDTESGRYGSSTNMNEPAGASRERWDINTNNISTNNLSTNSLNEPSGASSSQQDKSQQQQPSGTQANP